MTVCKLAIMIADVIQSSIKWDLLFNPLRLRMKLPEGSLSRRVSLGAGVAFFIQTGGNGLKYVSQVLLARWLGSLAFGNYSYALSWVQVLAVLAGLGFNLSVVRLVPQYLAQAEFGLLRGLLSRSRWLTWLAGAVIAALASLLVLAFPLAEIDAATLALGLWLIPLFAQINLGGQLIRGTQGMAEAFFPSFILQPMLVLGGVGALLLATGSVSSVNAVLVTAGAYLLVVLTQEVLLHRRLPEAARTAAPAPQTAQWLKLSLPFLLIGSASLVLNQADILIVGAWLGPEPAGIYTAATKTATLVGFILGAVNAIAAPMFSELQTRGDRRGLKNLVDKTTWWIILPSLAISLVMILFSRQILGLFGEVFTSGQTILIIIILGQLFNALAGPVGNLLSYTGYQQQTARVYLAAAVINTLANLVVVPFAGMTGAAIVTAGTTILWNAWLTVLVKIHLGIETPIYRLFLFWRRSEHA